MRRHVALYDSSSEVGAPTPSASGPPGMMPGRGPIQRIFSFLRAHPVLCLLILTPGIPEYLSSSSPVYTIVLNPAQFALQLAANLGLYGPGVLLIREAMIRWDKGWASVLLLGAAYGILEEGIALSTLFNPGAGPVGQLGYFGHWLGVSWVWSAGILPVHMIFSISIPILLLGLALPGTGARASSPEEGWSRPLSYLWRTSRPSFWSYFWRSTFGWGLPSSRSASPPSAGLSCWHAGCLRAWGSRRPACRPRGPGRWPCWVPPSIPRSSSPSS